MSFLSSVSWLKTSWLSHCWLCEPCTPLPPVESHSHIWMAWSGLKWSVFQVLNVSGIMPITYLIMMGRELLFTVIYQSIRHRQNHLTRIMNIYICCKWKNRWAATVYSFRSKKQKTAGCSGWQQLIVLVVGLVSDESYIDKLTALK